MIHDTTFRGKQYLPFYNINQSILNQLVYYVNIVIISEKINSPRKVKFKMTKTKYMVACFCLDFPINLA